jgi:hypothetical protein
MKCTSLTLVLLLLCICSAIHAQTPPNPTSNILWDDNPLTAGAQATYTDSTKTMAAFNNARRMEEANQGLPANILGNLTLPSPWNILSGKDKLFYLINSERTCRAGVDYPNDTNGAVLGMPLEKQDTALDAVAQKHADWLMANDLFQHNGANGITPFARIQARYPMNTCSEYLARAENIGFLSSNTTVIKLCIERALYAWIYNDASSAWGHREAVLLQNKDLQFNDPLGGFKNNFSSSRSEGLLGFGFGAESGGTYWPTNLGTKPTWLNRSEIVVMEVMDPTSSAIANANNCSYIVSAAAVAAVALPVVLEYFSVQKAKNANVLHWSTVSENNSKQFVIEHSLDGIHYESIAKVSAAGDSKSRLKYEYQDQNPSNGLHYYRLILEDWDGRIHLHKVVVIRNIKNIEANIYPTIAGIDGFSCAIQSETEQEMTLQIIDSQGNIQFSETINVLPGGSVKHLELPNMAQGIYFVNIATAGTKTTQKIVVE